MKNKNGNPNALGTLYWIKDQSDPKDRSWEEFYRNRWQHDKVVRSTHGVNCTGSCTWQIHVKDGIVTWEMQGLDYPELEAGLPPYEPRGCQRGISFSWYLYSPLRVKYPYARGVLLDMWQVARANHDDPVDAWKSLVESKDRRDRWHRARGKGGFRRTDWDTMLELMAAANIYTIQKHGPDRIAGFSPIPAMSMISYAGGARMMQLMGGVSLSFYDWYCDLPTASPETWGEQTDVAESADWYNSKLLAVMGANLNMTRTPDCHFAAEARHNGTKMWVFSPDFNQVAKYADEWVAVNAGQDGAWWMAVNHVILKEFHHEKQTPYFLDYAKIYSDSPYLVELTEEAGTFRPGKMLRANRLSPYQDIENGDWQFLMWDEEDKRVKVPMGSAGHRWGKEKGKWNLSLKDAIDGSKIHPTLTFLDDADAVVQARMDDFGQGRALARGVPIKYIETADGKRVVVATVYDLLMAQYGVAAQALNRAFAYDDTVLQHVGPASHQKGHCQVLLDEKDAGAFLGNVGKHVEDLLGDDRRQPHGRLVQQQEFGGTHQRPPDRQHLLFAAGQRARRLAQPLFEAREHGEDLLPVAADRGLVPAAVSAHLQVLVHAQAEEDVPPFGDMGHPALDDLLRRERVQRLVAPANMSAPRRHQARNDHEHGGLAGTVAPDEGDNLAFLHRQGYVLQGLYRAVPGVHVLDYECHCRAAPESMY